MQGFIGRVFIWNPQILNDIFKFLLSEHGWPDSGAITNLLLSTMELFLGCCLPFLFPKDVGFSFFWLWKHFASKLGYIFWLQVDCVRGHFGTMLVAPEPSRVSCNNKVIIIQDGAFGLLFFLFCSWKRCLMNKNKFANIQLQRRKEQIVKLEFQILLS